MKRYSQCAVFGAATLLLSATLSVAVPQMSQLDKDFLKAVNQSNNAERAYVPVVMKNSSNADVKKFGQTMIHDHTQANQDLVKLAASKSVKLPHNVPDEEQAVIDRLAQEKGEKFDAAYKHEMMRDHAADIGDFEREISLGSDPQVKAYAAKYLPVLKQHLQMAQNLKTGMNSMQNSNMKMSGNAMNKAQ